MQLLAVAGSGLTAGVLVCVALSIVPTFQALPPDRYVEVHRLIGRNFDPVMPLTVLVTAAVDVVLGLVVDPLFGLAAALLLVVSGVSHLANVPINRVVKASVPASGWDDPRGRWRAWNLVRTGCAVAALLVTAVAVVRG